MKKIFGTLTCFVFLFACDDPQPTTDAGSDADGTQSDSDLFDADQADSDQGDVDPSDGDIEPDAETGLGPLPPGPADAVGPYPVGVTMVEITDASREDRTLPVEVWYPAIHDEESRDARYHLELNGLRVATLESPLEAQRDAIPDQSAGMRPFIIFSHGNGGVRIQNIFQTEYLASHGFVVVSPDHTGNTMGDLLFGGDLETGMAQSAFDRPEDVSFIIDQFTENIDEILPILSGMIDGEQIGISGHSFGGYTSVASTGAEIDLDEARDYCIDNPGELGCMLVDGMNPDKHTASFLDERISVSVPLAPGGYIVFGETGMSQVAVPTLIQAGDVDRTTPLEEDQQPMYDGITNVPVWLAVIEGAGHYTFSDMCTLVDIFGKEAFKELGLDILTDGCGSKNIEDDIAHQIINTLGTAFFQIYLQDHNEASDYLVPGDFLTLQSQGL